MQFADNAQADLGLRCPLTEPMDIVVYIDEERILTRLHGCTSFVVRI